MTKEQLINEANSARRNKPSEVQYYRMIISEVERLENDIKNPVVATPEVVMGVITKLAKSLRECLAHRPDDAEFKRELAFYESFLPKTLNEVQITDIIVYAIQNNKWTKADKNALMQHLKSVPNMDMRIASQLTAKLLV